MKKISGCLIRNNQKKHEKINKTNKKEKDRIDVI